MRLWLAILMVATGAAFGQVPSTNVFYMRDWTGGKLNKKLTFTPLNNGPVVIGTNTVHGVSPVAYPTNGVAVAVLWPGNYRVAFDGLPAPGILEVPETNALVDARLHLEQKPSQFNIAKFLTREEVESGQLRTPLLNAATANIGNTLNTLLLNVGGTSAFDGPASFNGGLAGNGSLLHSLDAGALSTGTIPPERLPQSITGTFTGSGAGLTNLARTERVINVGDLMPVPGSASANRAAIQAALDATTNSYYIGGHSVAVIPPGDWTINDTLYFRMHSTTLRGYGPYRTRIYQTAANKDVFGVFGADGVNLGGTNKMWYLTVENLQVYKTPQPWTASMSAGFNFKTGIPASQKASRIKLSNVDISGFFYGVYAEHAVGLLFERVEAYGNNHAFYFEKADSVTMDNCFGGDAEDASFVNKFGTNTSSYVTFKASTAAPGFNLNIRGGESRRVSSVLDASSGSISLENFNVELIKNGPVFQLKPGVVSARLSNVRMQGREPSNLNPVVKFGPGVGRLTEIDPGQWNADLSPYPEFELSDANDWVNYPAGSDCVVTNTATASSWTVPLTRTTAGKLTVLGTKEFYFWPNTADMESSGVHVSTNRLPLAREQIQSHTMWDTPNAGYMVSGLIFTNPYPTYSQTRYVWRLSPNEVVGKNWRIEPLFATTNADNITFYVTLNALRPGKSETKDGPGIVIVGSGTNMTWGSKDLTTTNNPPDVVGYQVAVGGYNGVWTHTNRVLLLGVRVVNW